MYMYIYIYIYTYIKVIQSKPICKIFRQMPSSVSVCVGLSLSIYNIFIEREAERGSPTHTGQKKCRVHPLFLFYIYIIFT